MAGSECSRGEQELIVEERGGRWLWWEGWWVVVRPEEMLLRRGWRDVGEHVLNRERTATGMVRHERLEVRAMRGGDSGERDSDAYVSIG